MFSYLKSRLGHPLALACAKHTVFMFLKLDSRLCCHDFVAVLDFGPLLFERLGFANSAPLVLAKVSTLLEKHFLHQMCYLVALEKPLPARIVVDASWFSRTSGGEWIT